MSAAGADTPRETADIETASDDYAGRFAGAVGTWFLERQAAAANGPEGLLPLIRPIDEGLDRFPDVPLTIAEVAAVSRGQFVRPEAGFAAGAERYRLRGPSGELAAIATDAGTGRLAPDKVLVSAGADA